MKIINRSGVMVIPKGPYLDWARQDTDEVQVDAEGLEPTVYLISEYETDEQLDEILRSCYADIFEHEVVAWDERESAWSQNRNYDLFLDWFDVVPVSEVIDVPSATPLRHEYEV